MNGTAQAEWAISPADRAKYMQMFSALDKNKKGYLTGSHLQYAIVRVWFAEPANIMLLVFFYYFFVGFS